MMTPAWSLSASQVATTAPRCGPASSPAVNNPLAPIVPAPASVTDQVTGGLP